MDKDYLTLKRASASRPSGEWSDDDYDVLADGAAVGRIMKAAGGDRAASWPKSSARPANSPAPSAYTGKWCSLSWTCQQDVPKSFFYAAAPMPSAGTIALCKIRFACRALLAGGAP
jgi:hypothetical protein